MPKKRIKINLEEQPPRNKSRSHLESSGKRRSRKHKDYLKALEPGIGGMPIGGNLRMSRQSLDLESRIDYAGVEEQLKYYQEKIDEANKKKRRPSPIKNKEHLPLMPKTPKGLPDVLSNVKQGGRFTPGRIQLPRNK